jgi:hypothetical protein
MALATGRVVQKRRRGGSQLPEQWLKLLRSIQNNVESLLGTEAISFSLN